MEQHVKIIGILDIVIGALFIFVGLLLLLFATVGAVAIGASGEQAAGPVAAIIASVGLVGGTFFIALGVFKIIVGVKLRQHKPWARIVQIIFAILALPSFPVGTALGVYYLWAMFNQDTLPLFE